MGLVGLLAWITALLLMAPSRVSAAVVFDVDDPRDASDAELSDGLCETAAGTCTLRAAIQQTNVLTGAGTDRINLPAGTYALTILGVGEDGANKGDLDITDDLEIFGAGPGKTILDARGIDRIFEIHDGIAAWITGVTIRNGLALHSVEPSYVGGGIRVGLSASLDLQQCAVRSNTANAGGGLYASTATVTVSDCSFSGNMLIGAGLTNAEGAAIMNNQGAMDLERVEVSGNINAVTFVTAAAVYSSNAVSLAVRNSTISGHQGAGLRCSNSELDLVNSTIVHNSRGGLWFFSFDGSHPLTVRNSILAHNGALGGLDCSFSGTLPTDTDLDFSGEYNLDSDGTCPLDGGVDDLPSTEPLLGPLGLHGGTTRTHVPKVGSPVIDVGNNDRCVAPDQRGAPRPLDGGAPSALQCDIGAVEVLPCDPPYQADESLPAFETASAHSVEACYTITNSAEYRILAGGLVTWKARDALTLANGFAVLPGGSFEGLLDPAAGSLTPLP